MAITKDTEFVFGSVVTDKHEVFDKYKDRMNTGEDRTTLMNAIHDAWLAGRKDLENALLKHCVVITIYKGYAPKQIMEAAIAKANEG